MENIIFENIPQCEHSDVLVSPLRCVPRLSDLSPFEVADLFSLVHKIVPVIEQAFEGTSSTVVVQDGKDAGQTIQVKICVTSFS